MSEPKVSKEFVQAAFDAQAVATPGANLEAYANGLDALVKAAARGFAALDFETEPARFQDAQRRAAP